MTENFNINYVLLEHKFRQISVNSYEIYYMIQNNSYAPIKSYTFNVISAENLGNGHLRSTRWSYRTTSPIGTLN